MLQMVFKKSNPVHDILALLPPTAISFAASGGGPLVDAAMTSAAASARWSKALKWVDGKDPLVIDFSSTGLFTSDIDASNIHFDFNGNFFAERTGWLTNGAGFLVHDKDRNGRIDDPSELFGTVLGSGFAELAQFDTNHNGNIDADDVDFGQLEVWIDANEDGITDSGELHSLASLNIDKISLSAADLGDSQTGSGATLRAAAIVTLTDGSTRIAYEAVFPANHVDSVYAGESGRAAWQQTLTLDAKGFGTVTNLAVAMANDIALGELAAATAASMTTPKLKTPFAQAGDVLGAWGATNRPLFAQAA